MANFKQTTIETKSGKEYKLQHPGVRTVSKINDRIKNRYGVASDELLADEMLKYVIVEPKMKAEDFGDDFNEYSEVVSRAYAWVTGQGDEPSDNEEGSKGKSGTELE